MKKKRMYDASSASFLTTSETSSMLASALPLSATLSSATARNASSIQCTGVNFSRGRAAPLTSARLQNHSSASATTTGRSSVLLTGRCTGRSIESNGTRNSIAMNPASPQGSTRLVCGQASSCAPGGRRDDRASRWRAPSCAAARPPRAAAPTAGCRRPAAPARTRTASAASALRGRRPPRRAARAGAAPPPRLRSGHGVAGLLLGDVALQHRARRVHQRDRGVHRGRLGVQVDHRPRPVHVEQQPVGVVHRLRLRRRGLDGRVVGAAQQQRVGARRGDVAIPQAEIPGRASRWRCCSAGTASS